MFGKSLCLVACLLLLGSLVDSPLRSADPVVQPRRVVEHCDKCAEHGENCVRPTVLPVVLSSGRDDKDCRRSGNPVQVRCAGLGNTPWSLAFSPDSTVLAVGRHDGSIDFFEWDGKTKVATIAAHVGPVGALSFSADGKTLASADDLYLKFWRVEDRKRLVTMKGFTGRIVAVTFAAVGDALATASGHSHVVGEVKLWNSADRKLLANLAGHNHSVSAVAFSSDGAYLAAGGAESRGRGGLSLWNLSDGRRYRAGDQPTNHVLSVAFVPRSNIAFAGLCDGHIRAWDAADGKQKAHWHGHTTDVFFAGAPREGTMLVTAAHDNTIRFWDGLTGKQLTSLYDCEGHVNNGELVAVAISPNGKLLAVGRIDGRVAVWDVDALLKAGPTPLYACCACCSPPQRWRYPPNAKEPTLAPVAESPSGSAPRVEEH